MSKPTAESQAKVKRVVRYLVGAHKVVWKYGEFKTDARKLRLYVHVDSDWAKGRVGSRRVGGWS